MKSMWQRLLADETGVVLSSELALVGTVGVLGMVVGLDAVTCSVTSELNDLASAFGAIDQSYNYRGISKAGHARANGSGFNDRGDVCDCVLISQNDVSGSGGFSQGGGGFSQGAGGFSQSTVSQRAIVSSPSVVQEQVINERVIDEVIVEPQTIKAAAPVCPDDEIIEEHIIRRRVKASGATTLESDCSTRLRSNSLQKSSSGLKSNSDSNWTEERIEIKKPKKKG